MDGSRSDALPPPPRTRSGSETRQKQLRVTYRVTEAEYTEIELAASKAGLTIASFSRACILGAPITRARHRPSVDILALAKLQNELNRIGSNIFQLLRHVNFGRLIDTADEIRQAFAGYREAIAALMALRRQCEPPPPAEPESEPDLEPTL